MFCLSSHLCWRCFFFSFRFSDLDRLRIDLRHPLPTLLWHIYASTLLPLFNNLWLGQGTGNSNFFYAATLVFGVANGAVLLDGVWAGLSASYEMRRDGRYGGKEDEGEEKEEGYSLVQI